MLVKRGNAQPTLTFLDSRKTRKYEGYFLRAVHYFFGPAKLVKFVVVEIPEQQLVVIFLFFYFKKKKR
jgi:hypothetical protein